MGGRPVTGIAAVSHNYLRNEINDEFFLNRKSLYIELF